MTSRTIRGGKTAAVSRTLPGITAAEGIAPATAAAAGMVQSASAAASAGKVSTGKKAATHGVDRGSSDADSSGSASASGNLAAGSSGNLQDEGSVENTDKCRHCGYDVARQNIVLHELHCSKYNVFCQDCGERVDREELSEHREQEHGQTPCDLCHELITNNTMQQHKAETCPQRLVSCRYCEIPKPSVSLSEHEEACGARTDKCSKCGQYVRFSDQQLHDSTNCSQPAAAAAAAAAPNVSQSSRRLDAQTAALLELTGRELDGPADFVSAVLKQSRRENRLGDHNLYGMLNRREMANESDGLDYMTRELRNLNSGGHQDVYNQFFGKDKQNAGIAKERLNADHRTGSHGARGSANRPHEARASAHRPHEARASAHRPHEARASAQRPNEPRASAHRPNEARGAGIRKAPVLKLRPSVEALESVEALVEQEHEKDSAVSGKRDSGLNKGQRGDKSEQKTAYVGSETSDKSDNRDRDAAPPARRFAGGAAGVNERGHVQKIKNSPGLRSLETNDAKQDALRNEYRKAEEVDMTHLRNSERKPDSKKLSAGHDDEVTLPCEICGLSVILEQLMDHQDSCRWSFALSPDEHLLEEISGGIQRQVPGALPTAAHREIQIETQREIQRETEREIQRDRYNDRSRSSNYDERSGRLVHSSEEHDWEEHAFKDSDPFCFEQELKPVPRPTAFTQFSQDSDVDGVKEKEAGGGRNKQDKLPQQRNNEILIPCEFCQIPIVFDELLEHERFCFHQDDALGC